MLNKILYFGGSSRIIFFALVISLLPLDINGQQLKIDSLRLKSNLLFLADDSLKGRAPGTEEDSIAATFIANQLRDYGFVPLIGNSILIPFSFTNHREVVSGSVFRTMGRELKEGVDFRILPISPNGKVEGEIISMEFADLKRLSADPSVIESSPMKKIYDGKLLLVKVPYDSIQFYTTPVSLLGFKALLFYSSGASTISGKSRSSGVSIPVVWISDSIAGVISNEKNLFCEIAGNINVVRARSFNIAAVIPGAVNRYIMAGAHYDHLGKGGEGSGSMLRSGEGIHNGADDNASGVVSVLEAGRALSELFNKKWSDDIGNYGVAIAAFGAEERGLIGSKILADTLLALNKLPAMMINLDMVGRMKENKLQTGGAGTFKGADSLIRKANEKFNFQLTITNDGFGPSDHSSFYNKGVPVLYFTTGVHKEYHTPEDDAKLINFKGLKMVTEYLTSIISEIIESRFNPEYVKSVAPASDARRSFKVTLGLIPDFTYEKGDGFRVGSVTDGRPAQIAGMKEGDIIINMNSKKINNIYDYMTALGELKQGSKTQVVIKRDSQEIILQIEL